MGDVQDYERAHEALLARGPGRMIPDLDRITMLLGLLGDPQLAYPSVHITGTNGKTSVTRMISTLCAAVGVAPGAYMSPHLQSVRERMQVAGRPIPPSAFAQVYEEMAPLMELVDAQSENPADRVTYFEALTAMATWWFADLPVDIGIFEVGMGGRWDATNLVRGEVAVFTPIDVDHSQLGGTPEEIVIEKAGIIKDGAVVVTARQTDAVLAHLRTVADAHGAEIRVAGIDFAASNVRMGVGGQVVDLRLGERLITDVPVPLFGAHQAENAALALAAFDALATSTVAALDDDLIRAGFSSVTVPGRLEVISRNPKVVLDGAHNPHGAQAAAATIKESLPYRNLILVAGVMADKDVAGVLGAYRDVANHVVTTQARTPRAMSAARLADVGQEVWAGTGVIVEQSADIAEALELATGLAGDNDLVLVTGSLYTVGAARDLLVPFVEAEPNVITDEELEEEHPGDYAIAIDEMIDRVDSDRATGLPDTIDLNGLDTDES